MLRNIDAECYANIRKVERAESKDEVYVEISLSDGDMSTDEMTNEEPK